MMQCLEACETWDGRGVTDGFVAHKTVILDNTVEVRGQMSAFKGRDGMSIELFEAYITLDETRTIVESAVIRYGDAERGIGGVERGEAPINPRSVVFWLYEFHKETSAATTDRIDDPEYEARLLPIALAYRAGGGDHPQLSSVLEYLLLRCLHACEAWDGRGVPDGVVSGVVTVRGSTIEVRGQMASFNGEGNCIEPLEVIITLDDEGTKIESMVLRYGDAERGIWAVPFGSRGIDPRSVSTWLYEFRK